MSQLAFLGEIDPNDMFHMGKIPIGTTKVSKKLKWIVSLSGPDAAHKLNTIQTKHIIQT